MPERVRRRLGDERGISLVMVAIFLPVLLLFAGLVLDTGFWWVHKRHIQIQADAAALAGATAFRFPACDDAEIERTAVEYSGGLDPDHSTVTPDFNLMRDTTPEVPDRMHTAIQEPSFWGDEGIVVDEDLRKRPGPCAAQFIDVKITEEDTPGFFARRLIPEIDAQARVSLRQLTEARGLLPIGVEDVNPVRVHVWMYDEDTGQLIGEAELERRPVPESRVYIWDNATDNGGVPMAVPNVTSRRIGFRVALSGNPGSVDCTAPLVVCYGYKAPVPDDPNKVFDRGLGRVRGHNAAGTGPRLGELRLTKPATTGCGFNDVHDTGYLALSCTRVDVAADLLGVATTGTSVPTVRAFMKDGSRNNAETDTTLSWDPATGRWIGTILAKGPGPLPVRIEWRQTSGALPNGTVCSTGNANPCKGEFADAHAHFSGDRSFAGPIRHFRVDTSTGGDGHNVRRCAPGAAVPCPETFTVRLGVGGRLELGQPSDPPIALRIFGGGSRNQSLDCDDAEPLFEREIANGCGPWYRINTGQACPAPAALWNSPQPWNCVAVQTGTATSKPAKGLNQRVLCGPGNEANCPQFGKAEACTVRNAWPDHGVPGGDSRVLTLFLVPFGSFDSQGTGTVPVMEFAFFYVTGWTGPGGFENPCKTESPSSEQFVAGTENDQGVISGHFIKPTLPNDGTTGGDQPCDTGTIGGCVAVMTK